MKQVFFLMTSLMLTVLPISAFAGAQSNPSAIPESEIIQLTKGMTPEQAAELRKGLAEMQAKTDQLMKEYEAMSPEEQKKFNDETKKKLADPKTQENIKKTFESMSSEQKEVIKKYGEMKAREMEEAKAKRK